MKFETQNKKDKKAEAPIPKSVKSGESSLPQKQQKSSLKNFWEGVLAAGIIFTGGEGVKAETNEPITFRDKSSVIPELVVDTAQKEKASSPDALRQELIKKTGYDMMAIAEKAGFTVRLDVDNDTGPYIVHIGQTHYQETSIEFLKSWEAKEGKYQEIISVQKKIEQVLLAFSKQSNSSLTNIFTEGIAKDGYDQTGFSKNIEDLSKINPKEGCFFKVLLFYERAKRYKDNNIKLLLTYSYRQKLNELHNYFIAHPGQYDRAEQEFQEVQKKITNEFDSLGQDGIYLAGADRKLAVEGKIHLMGTETVAGNKAAQEVINEMAKMFKHWEEMSQEDKAKLSERDRQEFLDKATKLIKKNQKFVMDDREDIAIAMIKEINLTLKQRILPFVLGGDHNLTRGVLDHNRKNSDKKMGLITFVPDKPKSINK